LHYIPTDLHFQNKNKLTFVIMIYLHYRMFAENGAGETSQNQHEFSRPPQ